MPADVVLGTAVWRRQAPAPVATFAERLAPEGGSYPPVLEHRCRVCARAWREVLPMDHWEG